MSDDDIRERLREIEQRLTTRLMDIEAKLAMLDSRLGVFETRATYDVKILRAELGHRVDGLRTELTQTVEIAKSGLAAELAVAESRLRLEIARARQETPERPADDQ